MQARLYPGAAGVSAAVRLQRGFHGPNRHDQGLEAELGVSLCWASTGEIPLGVSTGEKKKISSQSLENLASFTHNSVRPGRSHHHAEGSSDFEWPHCGCSRALCVPRWGAGHLVCASVKMTALQGVWALTEVSLPEGV